MRELHVVAVSEDGRHVLLAGQRGATKGGFRVALDDRLAAAVRGDLPRPGEAEPHASELTPKEIQARLRAGESAASIAAAAGVPVSRVERFSGPVQGEMARVIDAARACHLVRGRLGRSAVPLGAAVDAALAGLPVREDSTEWSTRRDEDGTWLVTVSWFARARSREASWRWDPTSRSVTAVDPASAALGHVDADPAAATRAARRPAPARSSAAPSGRAASGSRPTAKAAGKRASTPAAKAAAKPAAKPTAKPAATSVAKTRTTSAAKSAAKPVAKPVAKAPRAAAKPVVKAPKAAAKPVTKAAAEPAAKPKARSAAKPATTLTSASAARPAAVASRAAGPTPARSSARTTAARTTAARKAAARPTGASGRPRVLQVVPDPEPAPRRQPRPAGAARDAARKAAPRAAADRDGARDGVKARATVPGWADVLLGTSPGGER